MDPDPDADLDPAIFIIDLPKMPAKNKFFKSLFAYYCLKVHVRGVLGNKCAGHHNLKTVHFRELFALGNFLAWFSGVCVFFYSALSTLGWQWRVFK